VEKTGKKRPWKSKNDFHFSHSFNNNNRVHAKKVMDHAALRSDLRSQKS